MKLTYYSTIKDGRLQKNVSEVIAKELHHFEGKRIELTIQKLKSTRSTQQNRYWWLMVGIVAKEIGYTSEELHEILKRLFLTRTKVNEKTGEIYEYAGSTAKLNKTEFSDLVENFKRWAAQEFDIVLPDAGQNFDLNFND